MSRTRPKEKRRGGARDESEIMINWTMQQLMDYLIPNWRIAGVQCQHDFYYKQNIELPEPKSVLPILWRKVKRTIRKHIDGWQQELPLF